ncbi:MAG: hypothetical protein A2942_02540 [Candidatus Lloydbacteria bacterium RIFCSPLOWO2_01_FULL_50_20]|uniref:Uncharacterized protein n=1 Tax=Candidatus Lloydbacteria bacterium RIFCSPLOWO2_01_FULL_50_20 TaxID=1798665 RepID=A0A1G2DEX9_9BACT|nr:MAG: hypothetical protein A3C13_01890 [Candidatus Lloydbacteria bacterium RIFCSPHIGHO2_02_FULL_50_11]OGZ12126.1 MAG: hypothetical protein A2942_02540 [Candidatus Lloydbacteria bacterium RIFCSPLOWO2_01_FULL_50_20]
MEKLPEAVEEELQLVSELTKEDDVKKAEDWLRASLESCVSVDDLNEFVKKLKDRVGRTNRAPHTIADDIVNEYYERLAD